MTEAEARAVGDRADGAEFFLGRWRFSRRIEDRRAGLIGTVTGEAAFERRAGAAAVLDYAESGVLEYGGRRVQAEQRQAWAFAAPNRIEISDRDGAALCVLDLDAPALWARHVCGADLYETRLSRTGAAWRRVWRQVWRVAGPRKDYVSETFYRRS